MSKEINIKSELLNDDDFKFTKDSLVTAAQKDGVVDFRVKGIEYFNDSSYENDDQFFYDMLNHVRILDPDSDHAHQGAVAFTTPDTLIYLNMPNKAVPENVRNWDFVYCHECLHQLWDTFSVAEKIKANGQEYNHDLLNIASDCVINDYLEYYRKKPRFENGIFPDVLEKQFGVEYNRKTDTQYTLYLKLLDKKNEVLNDPEIQKHLQRNFDGKIKPKEVKKQSQLSNSMPGAGEKHSKEYIEGWGDAIQDVLDKKVDVTKYKHKKHKGGDYDDGYDDCIKQIKRGLENGIELSDNPSGGSSSGSDLPDIPWDLPKQENDSGGDSSDKVDENTPPEDSANKAEEAANNAQASADAAKEVAEDLQNKADEASKNNSENADKAQEAADKAQEAADKAQEAADKAQDAADKAKDAAEDGDGKGASKAANEAIQQSKEAANQLNRAQILSVTVNNGKKTEGQQKDDQLAGMSGDDVIKDAKQSADLADTYAKNAEQSAENAKKSGSKNADDIEKAAKLKREVADKAKEAAEDAKKAADKGDIDQARDAAKKAWEKMKAAMGNGQQAGNPRNIEKDPNKPWWGSGSSGLLGPETEEDLKKIREEGKQIIEDYKNKISGVFGNFTKQCKMSSALKNTGLMTNVERGNVSWNKQMNAAMIAEVKRRVNVKKRAYQTTYSRIKRGSGVVKFGEPISPGRRQIEKGLIINVAIYVDRSGSMYNCIQTVFKACYQICESIKKLFKSEKVIDNIAFKIFVFDDHIHELEYGKSTNAMGGNCSFEELLDGIQERTKDFTINIIITDAGFDAAESKVNKEVDKFGGIVIFITNIQSNTIEDISKGRKDKKLIYILADSNFKIG